MCKQRDEIPCAYYTASICCALQSRTGDNRTASGVLGARNAGGENGDPGRNFLPESLPVSASRFYCQGKRRRRRARKSAALGKIRTDSETVALLRGPLFVARQGLLINAFIN